MTDVTVYDDGGVGIPQFNYHGRIYPRFRQALEIFDGLPAVKIRDDDILVCAYPKSGTHWVWEISRLLLAGQLDSDDVSKMFSMLELFPEETYKDQPSPRILNTHLLYNQLPVEALKKKTKIVLIHRNPKDACVSHYNFLRKIPFILHKGEWQNYVRPFFQGKFEYGSWFEYVKDWESVKKTHPDHPILTLRYEDFHENAIREIQKLNEFLGVNRSDQFVKDVCKRCEFQTLSTLKAKSYFGNIVYRKGTVGDWKNWFTVSQSEWVDQMYQEQMEGCDLTLRYTLP